MGGKNSHGTSTNTPTIPPWLSGILQPLLSGSAMKLGEMQNQGWDVLQGNTPQTGVSLEELQQQAAAAAAGRGGGGHGGPAAAVDPGR